MKKALTGNEAAAQAVLLAKPEVITAYPITPQTTISESLAQSCAAGKIKAEFINVESEDSALAAIIGASIAGARVFTATSCQGLLYMHQLLHWAAGARLPLVMVNVNRGIAPPWNLWPDQLDSLSQRDTGWIQLYCESNQEILDTVLQAFKLAEKSSLPVMVNYEGFVLSHTVEAVEITEENLVDQFLPKLKPGLKLKPGQPQNIGGVCSAELYQNWRFRAQKDIGKIPEMLYEIDREFSEFFGRRHWVVDLICPKSNARTKYLLIAMGSIINTARGVIEEQNDYSLLKVRLFRPFPNEFIRRIAGRGFQKIAVVNRALPIGTGAVLTQEIKNALYGLEPSSQIFSFIAGVGGVDITPQKIKEMMDYAASRDASSEDILWER